ncbi:Cell surface glycoprotein 1 [Ceratobasidium theobromae]|uniref:Cell surface glycoprotein 1 n=1 Tax=Ceratobasidium theobromae TaxID=1582974 RepID=A0A5N5QXT8_9AGAM|nr:Cell surface glycoprotein 1 [Ceratobasidium theobromae]
MVLDATSRVFSKPKSALNGHSSSVSTSSAGSPLIQNAPNRPTKRRRITQSGIMTPAPTPSPTPAPILDLDALDAARRRAAGRVMSLWESLAEKYARGLDEDDEIDILTGKIYKDRGVLRAVSERGWKIGSFGEALEVEPLGMISEGETETGTSEADDEGEGEDDTEGEGADDAVEREDDDPFGAWSYDWQYRVLPPPRPELSPQDAEDLKEFLAAESAIKESLRKDGKKVDQEPEEGDDVVYLGGSLHNMDGSLRSEDTSEDEFASITVGNSTIRYMKREDEGEGEDEDEDDKEVDDVEPVSSILGALALGTTPRKPASAIKLGDTKGDSKHTQSPTSPDPQASNRTSGGSQTSILNGPLSSPTKMSCSSDAGVEDDLIVISDSDEESEVTDIPNPRSGIPLSSPSKKDASSPSVPFRGNPRSRPPGISMPVLSSTPHGSSSRLNPPSASSLTAPTASLQSSTTPALTSKDASQLLSVIPLILPPATNSLSKRMLSQMRSKASKAGLTKPRAPSNDLLDSTSFFSSAAIMPNKPTDVLATVTSTSGKSSQGTLAQSSDGLQHVGKGKVPAPKLTRSKISATGIQPENKEALGPDTAIKPGSVLGLPVPNLKPLLPMPDSSPRSAEPESPVKSRKKAAVVEVVLPTPRRTKIKREQTAPPPSTSKNAVAKTSERVVPQAPSLQANSTTSLVETNAEAVSPESELSRKRKRDLGGDECVDALEPKAQAGPVGPAPSPNHACCQPTSLEQGQGPVCYSAHFEHQLNPPPPHAHVHTHHSIRYPLCPTHHSTGIPIYQHQHQHQHLHTHLPYPLPQLPFTANELTEAALKLMYGLSALQHAPGVNGSPAPSLWFPPGTPIPFGFPHSEQAGSSSRPSAPKLEASSSQETILNEEERIPSSQEHERKLEALAHSKKLTESSSSHSPAALEPKSATPPPPVESSHAGCVTDTNTQDRDIPVTGSSHPAMLRAEREMSIIDIESDSEDEFDRYDVGEGSMRWEPPIKDEDSSDDDDSLYSDSLEQGED